MNLILVSRSNLYCCILKRLWSGPALVLGGDPPATISQMWFVDHLHPSYRGGTLVKMQIPGPTPEFCISISGGRSQESEFREAPQGCSWAKETGNPGEGCIWKIPS